MKTIPLTQGKVAKVDNDDYAIVSKYKWYARNHHGYWYAFRNGLGYLHQFILGKKWVDHRNGDGLDNRRQNLRLATRSQNGANSRGHRGTVSGLKGIDFHKSRGLWRARIMCRGRRVDLGHFSCLQKALSVYQKAAKTYFGDFARV